jgi:alpha-galactosidase
MQTATERPIKLNGLDPDKKYRIKEINLYPGTTSKFNSENIYSGNFLMTIGINPDINISRASVLLEVNEAN